MIIYLFYVFFFTVQDNCFVVWLSPTPSDSNRKWWENILNANKAVSIDLHQGYKSKLNNKFWKVLQFRETDHLSGRSIPSVSHTPSTSSSYTLEAKFYKYLFFPFKIPDLWGFPACLMFTLSISFESPQPAERPGSVNGYYFKATHICILFSLHISSEGLWPLRCKVSSNPLKLCQKQPRRSTTKSLFKHNTEI